MGIHKRKLPRGSKCRVQYFDSASKSLKTYTAAGNTELTDTLNIYKKSNSLEEAQRIAAACLKNGSKEITGSIELALPLKNRTPSRPSDTLPLGEGENYKQYYSPVSYFCAGINFNLTGIGRLSSSAAPAAAGKFTGMYHIKSSTRTIDSTGLNIKGDIQKC